MARKKKKVTVTPVQALAAKVLLLDSSKNQERSGTLATFRLADLLETLDMTIGRLQEGRARIQKLAERAGSHQLIAEASLTDGELSDVFQIAATAHHSLGQEISVATPDQPTIVKSGK